MHAAQLFDIRVKSRFALATTQQASAVRKHPETP
jgi:hypothetical protein